MLPGRPGSIAVRHVARHRPFDGRCAMLTLAAQQKAGHPGSVAEMALPNVLEHLSAPGRRHAYAYPGRELGSLAIFHRHAVPEEPKLFSIPDLKKFSC